MKFRKSLGATALTFFGTCLCTLAACTKQQASAPPVASEPHPLEGYWEGEGESGKVSITIEGDSLHFYERPDFQYDTTFTLAPGTDPLELHATILDSPRTSDAAGELVIAIYEFEDGVLNIAAVDKSDGEPVSFEDATSRYRLERVQPRK